MREDGMLYTLNGVTKRYIKGRQTVDALNGIDLGIAEGEFLAIQGSTGSGKTTLLQMLGALDRPSGGEVLFDGRDLGRLSESGLCELRSHSFGFVFQSFNLIPTLTAQENVETALVPWKVSGEERRRRAAEALAGVGLADRARHIPFELSGGEQQRVAIARALVRAPRVILGDEPTGNLDERTRDDIIGLLESLWREKGQTVVLVTHDTWVASRASRRIWLDEGRITDAGYEARRVRENESQAGGDGRRDLGGEPLTAAAMGTEAVVSPD
jgi:putative ABC transport system ATP-binding protein